MMGQPPSEAVATGHSRSDRLGLFSASLTSLLGVVTFGLAITTPARSGPGCASGCIIYPYVDVAAFVPRDYVWVYPAILFSLAFLLFVGCIYDRQPGAASRLGSLFACISTTLITLDYFVQLAVVEPSLLKGESEGLVLFSMYNPHGLFIALEDLGYLMMSLAFVFVGAGLSGRARLERVLRWLLVLAGSAGLIAFVGLSVAYGPDLEYRFELAIISINWTTLIIAGALASFWFRRKVVDARSAAN